MAVPILIAEDDALLRECLVAMLECEEDLAVVGTVGDGRECLEAVDRHKPRLVLLDLHLRGLSGQKVLESLLELEEPPLVLVLTGDEEDETQLAAARSGARGFIPKSQARSVLAKAIRAVASGELWFTPGVSDRILREHQQLLRRVRQQERPLNQLSDREREVLAGIARGKTNGQIAAELYMSVHTVKLHVQNILRKLELPNRTEAAVFAVREGLLDN